MKKAKFVFDINLSELEPIILDDFSRFKEKLIMINTLESLAGDMDKALLKAIAKKEGGKLKPKKLKRALKKIIDNAIEQVSE